jgi:hypothetical protein
VPEVIAIRARHYTQGGKLLPIAMILDGLLAKWNPCGDWRNIPIALIDNEFRFVSWVCFHASFSGGTEKHWGPCHKRVPAVVIECVEAAILATFLRHLRAGFVFSASG